eukprot:CAMPEP_0182898318 /NCGR_PEP_ID=MMETSP0034_2-20130328/27406_1 /TAXON_ID=156128 /ORGANISM="Nephroselmis pyriformis, Strain CCMP717" /LENGTH=515 /DNA_ID=CAMNT_0025032281 /DNA_START=197 /DNA_END=1741 /DNA_ORIENTATION=-
MAPHPPAKGRNANAPYRKGKYTVPKLIMSKGMRSSTDGGPTSLPRIGRESSESAASPRRQAQTERSWADGEGIPLITVPPAGTGRGHYKRTHYELMQQVKAIHKEYASGGNGDRLWDAAERASQDNNVALLTETRSAHDAVRADLERKEAQLAELKAQLAVVTEQADKTDASKLPLVNGDKTGEERREEIAREEARFRAACDTMELQSEIYSRMILRIDREKEAEACRRDDLKMEIHAGDAAMRDLQMNLQQLNAKNNELMIKLHQVQKGAARAQAERAGKKHRLDALRGDIQATQEELRLQKEEEDSLKLNETIYLRSQLAEANARAEGLRVAQEKMEKEEGRLVEKLSAIKSFTEGGGFVERGGDLVSALDTLRSRKAELEAQIKQKVAREHELRTGFNELVQERDLLANNKFVNAEGKLMPARERADDAEKRMAEVYGRCRGMDALLATLTGGLGALAWDVDHYARGGSDALDVDGAGGRLVGRSSQLPPAIGTPMPDARGDGPGGLDGAPE